MVSIRSLNEGQILSAGFQEGSSVGVEGLRLPPYDHQWRVENHDYRGTLITHLGPTPEAEELCLSRRDESDDVIVSRRPYYWDLFESEGRQISVKEYVPLPPTALGLSSTKANQVEVQRLDSENPAQRWLFRRWSTIQKARQHPRQWRVQESVCLH